MRPLISSACAVYLGLIIVHYTRELSVGLVLLDALKHIQLNSYYVSQFVIEFATEKLKIYRS
jgi:hypothetical protein